VPCLQIIRYPFHPKFRSTPWRSGRTSTSRKATTKPDPSRRQAIVKANECWQAEIRSTGICLSEIIHGAANLELAAEEQLDPAKPFQHTPPAHLSEDVLDSELHFPHRSSRGNLSESGRSPNVDSWRQIVRVVCEIERLVPEFYSVALAN